MPAGQGKNIRRVTSVDVVRSKQGDGSTGVYTMELTLDGGVEEYVMPLEGSDVSTVGRLIQRSGSVLLDKNTEDLIFENYGGGG